MTQHRKIDHLFAAGVIGSLFLFSLGMALLFGTFEYIPNDGWHFWQVMRGSCVIAMALLWVWIGISALDLRDEAEALQRQASEQTQPRA